MHVAVISVMIHLTSTTQMRKQTQALIDICTSIVALSHEINKTDRCATQKAIDPNFYSSFVVAQC